MFPNYFAENNGPYYFERHLSGFADSPVDFLQIGVFVGESSMWMLDNALIHSDSTLTDVDTWLGSPEHVDIDFIAVENEYDFRVQGRTIKIKTDSDSFFASNDKQFDFVYIDAEHSLEQVVRDGTNGLNALKTGGIIAFDDFFHPPIIEAVKEIREMFSLEQIEEKEHQQAWFRKL